MIKRICSFLLVVVFLFSLVGCVSKSSHAEELLLAVKVLDLDAMSTHVAMPSVSSAVPFAQEKHLETMLDEQKKETLTALYALLQYTILEESAVEDGIKTMKISLKLPDFARIKTLAHTQILVSGKSAVQIVSEMLENGTITKNYMTEKTVDVKMTESNGEWFVLYSEPENTALFDTLALTEMFRFFASN